MHKSEYAQQLHSCMERVYNFARKHLQLKSDKMKEQYDSHAAGSELKEGDATSGGRSKTSL